jgi:type IV pilus assembly protein PilE
MKNSGFTLTELLIAIAIVGILAGVAYPSYMNYLLVSKRSEAQSALTDIANRQEMYYLDHHKYAANLQTDLGLSANPFITDNGYYSITTSSATATADFTLTATAISTQAADSDCATLQINQNSQRTATASNCWK